MIGLLIFSLGMLMMGIAQLINVQFNYDSESSIPMIVWSFVIMIAFALLYIFISVIVFGGIIL
jgi:hypothetical protein